MRLCIPWYFHGVGKNRYYANQESVVFPAQFLVFSRFGTININKPEARFKAEKCTKSKKTIIRKQKVSESRKSNPEYLEKTVF